MIKDIYKQLFLLNLSMYQFSFPPSKLLVANYTFFYEERESRGGDSFFNNIFTQRFGHDDI